MKKYVQNLVWNFLFSGHILLVGCPAHSGHAINKLGAEQDVGIVEHTVLQGHNNELWMLEVGLQHVTDVLGVAQVKGRVHLIENVERGRLEQQQG